MDKKQLRREIRELKKRILPAIYLQSSREIMSKIEQLTCFEKAENIIAYWALEDEVGTRDFIEKWYKRKNIYLPRVVGNDLEFSLYEGKSKMITEPLFGIDEPNGKALSDLSRIDVIIVPGMAFDYFGNRMGRGKGFYDRILNLIQGEKIGICFAFQLLDEIPTESHDIAMNMVITEEEVLYLC